MSVWVDEISSFGTFPLESMACDTPVIGRVPNLPNGWITEKNGMWVDNTIVIPDLIAQYIQSWLEDSVPEEIFSDMEETVNKFTVEKMSEKMGSVYSEIFELRKTEIKETLSKYKVDELEGKNN